MFCPSPPGHYLARPRFPALARRLLSVQLPKLFPASRTLPCYSPSPLTPPTTLSLVILPCMPSRDPCATALPQAGSPFLFLFQDPVSFPFSTYLRLYVSVVYYCLCSTRMSVLLRDAPLPDTVPGTYYIVNKLIKWNLFTDFKSSFCLFFKD